MDNPYVALTEAFNAGRLRALLSSGQAVVMHRLAVMSKDGHWILREDDEALAHVLGVLAGRGAAYRFGAPLDARWLAGGWSSHLEHRPGGFRLRTDFVTRPPRLDASELAEIWTSAASSGDAVLPIRPLAALKLTNREKDYPVVGELARRMPDPRDRSRYSRSSRDLIELASTHPDAVAEVLPERPLLGRIPEGRDVLDEELDRERRRLMRANEERLARYRRAAAPWAALWPKVQRETAEMDLLAAHGHIVRCAEGVLPFGPEEEGA